MEVRHTGPLPPVVVAPTGGEATVGHMGAVGMSSACHLLLNSASSSRDVPFAESGSAFGHAGWTPDVHTGKGGSQSKFERSIYVCRVNEVQS